MTVDLETVLSLYEAVTSHSRMTVDLETVLSMRQLHHMPRNITVHSYNMH